MGTEDPRDRRIRELEAQLQLALFRIEELEARLSQTSKNSSRPPSSDAHWKKPVKRTTKGLHLRGAVPGHPGHYRPLIPVEEVQEVIPLVPNSCQHCGEALGKEGKKPLRHQVTEIPE